MPEGIIGWPQWIGMVVQRSPTEITDEGWFWLRAKDVTGYPRIARDNYFPKHEVRRPARTTADHRPNSDDEEVSRIDLEAVRETHLSGKWIVERSPKTTDRLWDGIIDDVSKEVLWDAKVTTRFGHETFEDDDHVILVYTPNYFDRADVERVRDRLDQKHGVTEPIRYKPDIYTSMGLYEDEDEDTGLSDAARFTS